MEPGQVTDKNSQYFRVIQEGSSNQFDFSTNKVLKKLFQTVGEAKQSIENFKKVLSVNLCDPVVKRLENGYKTMVRRNHETKSPYVVVTSEKSQSLWKIVESTGETCKLIKYVVTLLDILNYPKLQGGTPYLWEKVSIAVRKELESRTDKLVKEAFVSVTFCKEEFIVEHQNLSDNAEACYLQDGVIQNFSSHEDALKAVQQFQLDTATKFIKRKRKKIDLSKGYIRWERSTNIPYYILWTKVLECQYGRNRNRARNDRRAPQKVQGVRKRKMQFTTTKKTDCNATIKITQIIKYPQFKTPNRKKVYVDRVSEVLREVLAAEDIDLVKNFNCYVKFPTNDDHSGHILMRFGNGDINNTEGFFTSFFGQTFECFMAAVPYKNSGSQFTCKVCMHLSNDFQALKQHLHLHFKQCYFIKLGAQEIGTIPCALACPGRIRKRHHHHCPFCHRIYENRTALKKHVITEPGKCVNSLPETETPTTNLGHKPKSNPDVSDIDNQPSCLLDVRLTFFVDQTFEDYLQMFAPDSDCPLCPFQSFSRNSLEDHLYTVHLNHSMCFIYGDSNYCCLPCKRNCLDINDSANVQGHFHCPCCKIVMPTSSKFEKHVTTRMGTCLQDAVETAIETISHNQDVESVEISPDEDEQNGRTSFSEEELSQNCTAMEEEGAQSIEDKSPISDREFHRSILSEMQHLTGEKKRRIQMDILELLRSPNYL